MNLEDKKCECGLPAKCECECGNGICHDCINDPKNPAAYNWYNTGWHICSDECERKAIAALKCERDCFELQRDRLQRELDEIGLGRVVA